MTKTGPATVDVLARVCGRINATVENAKQAKMSDSRATRQAVVGRRARRTCITRDTKRDSASLRRW